jgi:uncharacterized protein involved in response to NO
MRWPFAILFPAGALAGAAGVGHWIFYARGVLDGYSGQGHALIQIEGFLSAFAASFLLTMLPHHTSTAAPSRMEVFSIAALLSASAALSWFELWTAGQVVYLCGMLMIVSFVGSRLRQAEQERKPAPSFLLVPMGLTAGVLGAVLLVAQDQGLLAARWLVVARGLIQETMFLCLMLGAGHILHPALMGVPPYAPPTARGLRRAETIFLGLVIIGSVFAQEFLSERVGALHAIRIGYALRLAAVLWLYLRRMGVHRWPRLPGHHRRFLWISFWMIPLGLAMVTLLPTHRTAMLHIMLVGGFSLLAFSVAHHVIAVHTGAPELTRRSPWQVGAFGGLFLFAMSTRVSADFLPESYWVHIEAAAAAWIIALGIWVSIVLPQLIRGD